MTLVSLYFRNHHWLEIGLKIFFFSWLKLPWVRLESINSILQPCNVYLIDDWNRFSIIRLTFFIISRRCFFINIWIIFWYRIFNTKLFDQYHEEWCHICTITVFISIWMKSIISTANRLRMHRCYNYRHLWIFWRYRLRLLND